MKLSDFKGIFKKSTVTIISIDNPYEDYYSVKVKSDKITKWAPGEHAIFKMVDKEVTGKKSRSFSVASISEEGHILLGTRTGKEISSFKKQLINSKPGDKMSMTGPFGWFKLQDNENPIVMVAGGVGITPIRALLKELESNQARPIRVIYASRDYYLFGDELEKIEEANPKIELVKTTTSEETTNAVVNEVNNFGNDAWYYISGSQGFIKGVKESIVSNGVNKKRVINDPFLGY